jgi:hypothetical protein
MSDKSDDKGKIPSKPGDATQHKRPHATIDLKATVVPSGPSVPSAGPASPTKGGTMGPAETIARATHVEIKKTDGGAAKVGATTTPSATTSPQTQARTPRTDAPSPPTPSTAPSKSGGFFPMLGAGLVGGAIATAGSFFAPAILGLPDPAAQDVSPLAQRRFAAIEQSLKDRPVTAPDVTAKLGAIETRLARFEDQARGLGEAQMRLTAEAKALAERTGPRALDEAVSARLLKVEDQMKTIAAAADDPQRTGRVPQLAQLTGKVADLENALTTATTTLRRDVAKDVETRMTAATEASEAARAGTQRIDRDLAGLKTEAARISQRTQALELSLKTLTDESGGLKSALDTVKSDLGARSKPDDVKAAIAPVASRIESLEKNVQGVVKSEQDRNVTAERIVLSLELANLKRALDRGAKYGAELAAVKKLAGNKLNLSVLETLQNENLPTVPVLATEFRGLANAMLDADAEPTDGSVVDRLLTGAKSIVRVRKVNHAPGDNSAEAVIGRMETALRDSRLGDVIEEAKKLSDKVRAPAKAWLAKIDGRFAVEKALADIEAQLKGSLAGAAEPKKGNN